ncbi:hyaluronan-mediated motility receptor-like [Lingula anatina]|uniref:Hyaluronan-mediated motility receptor-like n=1 Tax=Lingula anatina TaxID=7574 RepID=A0A1S3I8J0_LINAN|nr:hyaluronan-mediated motility receptor-like [Lingula anatina]XP_013394508.1 hyaluronan-mediated motility receptor-like [Lingula anatina]|eukprot:XP_013394507.1 hyaluronan-mediated motility receptor-like [Lingula anatina]
MASKGRRDSTADSRTEAAILRNRVKELETEVSSLKKRLEDLRKAKNTTVLKREREVINVGTPFSNREAKQGPDQGKEVEDLKKKLEAAKLSAENTNCGHDKIIEDLNSTIMTLQAENYSLAEKASSLEADNAALAIHNGDLTERVSSLLAEMSEREAQKCEKEEVIEARLKVKWQQMYQEWMAATEQKIEELQAANALLRRMIRPPPDETDSSSKRS